MINATSSYRTFTALAPWFTAFGRLRLAAISPTVRRGMVIGLLGILSLSYVWQANASAAANVEIRSLQQKAAALEEDYSRLQRQAVQLRSLERVAEATAAMNLVALPGQQFAGAGAVVVAR